MGSGDWVQDGRGAEVQRGRGEKLTATSPLLPCFLAPLPPLLPTPH